MRGDHRAGSGGRLCHHDWTRLGFRGRSRVRVGVGVGVGVRVGVRVRVRVRVRVGVRVRVRVTIMMRPVMVAGAPSLTVLVELLGAPHEVLAQQSHLLTPPPNLTS